MATVDNFVIEVAGCHDEQHITNLVITPVVDADGAVGDVVGSVFCQTPPACDAFSTMPIDVNVLCESNGALFVDVI